MAPFFTGIDGGPPDANMLLLTEVFHLEDQLERVAPTHGATGPEKRRDER